MRAHSIHFPYISQAQLLILDDAEAAQQRQAAAAAEAGGRADRAAAERLRDPLYLPGELRPGGPRHDNDAAHYARVRVVPTCQELLCPEQPYLPSNRWGEGGEQRGQVRATGSSLQTTGRAYTHSSASASV